MRSGGAVRLSEQLVRLSGASRDGEGAGPQLPRAISTATWRVFFGDEKVRKIVMSGFSGATALSKANCLNYLISLGIKPKKEMTDFIGYEIDRS
jgi:hypothetical protein